MTPDSRIVKNNPKHIAFIMDGNNRWAKSKGFSPRVGYQHGAEAAKLVINACVDQAIPYVTLFAFSSENWVRPPGEIKSLMALFLTVLNRGEIQQLHNNNVRLLFIGKRGNFAEKIQLGMKHAEDLTKHNVGTTVIVAADYGGRWDLVNSTIEICNKIRAKELSAEQINEAMINNHTSLGGFPDPDLCIRTGGERRLSNFLLWHFAYTEFYFTDCFWPDFNKSELQLALDDYAHRQRRFGGQNKTFRLGN